MYMPNWSVSERSRYSHPSALFSQNGHWLLCSFVCAVSKTNALRSSCWEKGDQRSGIKKTKSETSWAEWSNRPYVIHAFFGHWAQTFSSERCKDETEYRFVEVATNLVSYVYQMRVCLWVPSSILACLSETNAISADWSIQLNWRMWRSPRKEQAKKGQTCKLICSINILIRRKFM